jgi:hypothetical protein
VVVLDNRLGTVDTADKQPCSERLDKHWRLAAVEVEHPKTKTKCQKTLFIN